MILNFFFINCIVVKTKSEPLKNLIKQIEIFHDNDSEFKEKLDNLLENVQVL